METLSDSIPRRADSGVGVESDDGFPGFDPGVIAELLAGLDPSGVDGDRLLAGIAGMERVVAAAHAAQVKMMAEFSRLRPAAREGPCHVNCVSRGWARIGSRWWLGKGSFSGFSGYAPCVG